jgi:pyrimidine deaminase RibD-like protein
MSGNPAHYVTLGGECFELSPQGKADPVTRDGLVYKFHVTDLKKNRGMRLVSVFAAGSLEITVSDYEQRIEIACINAIRRAFDNGTLSFDQPSDERYYKEIQLSASDLENKVTRTDAEIRQYIVHKSHWLAYRFPMQPQPDGIIYPIPFDEPADLDYLGATSAEVRRNIQRMANQGMLEKVLEGHARPTERLLTDYESAEGSSSRELPKTVSTTPATSGESDDRRFARLAIEEARKSEPEDDRVHPKVGVVVVKDGHVLATAHRGEFPQCHGEYIALEKKLPDVLLAGSTVYTTLEPCTSRNHPKVPCATRLAERKVARVVIGMLDPDDRISGRGQRSLRKAGVATALFDHDLMTEIEELNRDFIRERESQRRDTQTDQHRGEQTQVPSTQTEAARRLSDATRDLQKAAWSYIELHSRYGVAQAVRDVAVEEKEIFGKVEMALRTFERDYDLPSDLSRIAKDELANINVSLDRLMSGRDLETMKIAAEQIQDSCNRVREAAKPYAYLNRDAGDARRVEKLDLPAARPIIVPKRYGGGTTKDDFGYTGLGVINDGERPGYDLTIHSVQLADGTKLVFHRGHTERLSKNDGEAFYPVFLEARLGGTFGSALFDFMRERGIPSVTVPITYRDSDNNWFQTDITFDRDVQKSGGLRLGWKQKRIPHPDSEKAEAKKDVLLQPSVAASEGNDVVASRNSAKVSPQFDVFISHATEDKPYVEPLVKALEAAGIKVWFDKTALEWGDDLRASIDRGLANCRYGVVIFSKAFLRKKKWTEYELNSLFALEQPGRKIILPIWHGITRDDVLEYGAGFADRLAKVSSKDGYNDIVESLLGLLGRSIPLSAVPAQRSVLTEADPPQDVSEITLEAFYLNHDPDKQSFACQSVSETQGKYVDDTSADGSVMRSELEPPLLVVRGIDVKAVEALGWKPTGLRFKDAQTGVEKVFSGQLRDTVEPDTLKFGIHGGDAKSGTKPRPRTPVTAEPVAAKPNAIAYAWYETTGENAAKAKAFIRPSTRHDGWFSFENSFGEEMHGTKEEVAMKFAAFDKSLVLKHYVRMQHSTSDPAFKLN